MKRIFIENKKIFFWTLLTFLVGGLLPCALVASAFIGPSQAPPDGEVSFWRINGNNIYFNGGSVGIGTLAPSYTLHAQEDIYASGYARGGTGICIGSSCKTSAPSSVPSGIVLFFNLSSCPAGWSELTSARGRYIVGLPSGGTLAGTAGTALSNQENRATGQHSHTVDDPGHSHYVFHNPGIGLAGLDYDAGSNIDFDNPVESDSSYTEISIDNFGSVAGTNAPHIQLLVCEKD